jgi:hypothetical protein
MKRIHYVLGAAGLAPIAAGLAAPAAHAANVPSGAISRGKVVSLHHTGMQGISRQATAATLAAVTSSSATTTTSASATTSPAATAAGCHGNTRVLIPKDGHVKGRLWYKNGPFDSYTCIGTVDASLYYANSDCKWVDVSAGTYSRDLHNYSTVWGPKRKTVCGKVGKWVVEPFGIHESLSHDAVTSALRVYVYSQYGGSTYAQFGS